jgi:dihydrofolate reductase
LLRVLAQPGGMRFDGIEFLRAAMRQWAQKLEAKAKYVVSGSRSDFPWQNTIKVEGDLREAIAALKAKTERGVLAGAPKLAAALEELGLIDECRIVVHPIIVQALHFRRKAG